MKFVANNTNTLKELELESWGDDFRFYKDATLVSLQLEKLTLKGRRVRDREEEQEWGWNGRIYLDVYEPLLFFSRNITRLTISSVYMPRYDQTRYMKFPHLKHIEIEDMYGLNIASKNWRTLETLVLQSAQVVDEFTPTAMPKLKTFIIWDCNSEIFADTAFQMFLSLCSVSIKHLFIKCDDGVQSYMTGLKLENMTHFVYDVWNEWAWCAVMNDLLKSVESLILGLAQPEIFRNLMEESLLEALFSRMPKLREIVVIDNRKTADFNDMSTKESVGRLRIVCPKADIILKENSKETLEWYLRHVDESLGHVQILSPGFLEPEEEELEELT
eukprot:TRINITY_DN5424_c0_g1_i2.p1 TRINITY_DN5424_c0_g1~~TRINITY_DN5424_c0_g1_i2.p1  ORF type:complete len:330 (-),score=67.70 TRINITY_DN5424_c0_g1_i2:322-1311(-)